MVAAKTDTANKRSITIGNFIARYSSAEGVRDACKVCGVAEPNDS